MASCPTCRAIQAILMAGGLPASEAERISETPTVRKIDRRAKRKVKKKASAYSKEFGRQLKKLKRKHPRTSVTKLMKRAHTATRKARR